MISQGDTFWAADFAEGVDSHLLVVISDPKKNAEQLVLVTLTTWGIGEDDSCYLEPGDHSFVKHPTCVRYNGVPTTPSAAQLEGLISDKKLKRREPVIKATLEKILAGANDTKKLTNRQLRILFDQELID